MPGEPPAPGRKQEVADYRKWLRTRSTARVSIHRAELERPTDFERIYRYAVEAVTKALSDSGTDTELTFHTSPGTPQMAAAWIILAKTRFPAAIREPSPPPPPRSARYAMSHAEQYRPFKLLAYETP